MSQVPSAPPSERYADFHSQLESLRGEAEDDVVVTDPLYISALEFYRDEQQALINSATELRSYLTEICNEIDEQNEMINAIVDARKGRAPTDREVEDILALKTDKRYCAFKGTIIPSYRGVSFRRNGAYLQELAWVEGRVTRKRNYYQSRIDACSAKISCNNGSQPHPG
jgi:hypothetical protein